MKIIPSTFTWCAVTGVNSPRVERSAAKVEDQVDLVLGEDPLERFRSRTEPTYCRSTRRARSPRGASGRG